jgi:ribosome maturation factor RimP
MIDRALVTELVEENIAGTDIFIVDIAVKPDNVVSIVLDSDTVVGIDICADINRLVYSSLESKYEDNFELNVYSAGLSEPLKLKRQYIKHTGEAVEVVCKSGEKKKGVLCYIDDNHIEIEYETKEKEPGTKKKKTVKLKEKVDFDSIKSTKLEIKV